MSWHSCSIVILLFQEINFMDSVKISPKEKRVFYNFEGDEIGVCETFHGIFKFLSLKFIPHVIHIERMTNEYLFWKFLRKKQFILEAWPKYKYTNFLTMPFIALLRNIMQTSWPSPKLQKNFPDIQPNTMLSLHLNISYWPFHFGQL